MDDEPRRAYLIKWAVANEMEALVYAESAKDALERFRKSKAQATRKPR
jgi:hypothetical protein